MQELERHHAAINCRKSTEQNNLGETEGGVDKRLRDEQAGFRREGKVVH